MVVHNLTKVFTLCTKLLLGVVSLSVFKGNFVCIGWGMSGAHQCPLFGVERCPILGSSKWNHVDLFTVQRLSRSVIRGFTVNCPASKDGGSLCLIARASLYFSFYTFFHVTFNSHTLPLMTCRRLTWWCYTDYLYILELVQAAALLGCEIFHCLYV